VKLTLLQYPFEDYLVVIPSCQLTSSAGTSGTSFRFVLTLSVTAAAAANDDDDD